jgi:peptide deformylase
MAILRICKYPEPVLRRKTAEVKKVSEADKRLIEDMIETMKASGGVGLAANQVGVSRRIFVFNPSEEDWRADALINPAIIKRRGTEKTEEGCLSLPGISAEVRRYKHILVEGLDTNGRHVRFEARGLLARIIQHEVDHLDGKFFIDRINPLRRMMSLRRFAKEGAG